MPPFQYLATINVDEIKNLFKDTSTGLENFFKNNNFTRIVSAKMASKSLENKRQDAVSDFLALCEQGRGGTFVPGEVSFLVKDLTHEFLSEEKAFIYLLLASQLLESYGCILDDFVNVVSKNSSRQWTPLIKAARHNWPGLASLLLYLGAEINYEYGINSKLTALDVALKKHGEESLVYRLLLDNGGQPGSVPETAITKVLDIGYDAYRSKEVRFAFAILVLAIIYTQFVR